MNLLPLDRWRYLMGYHAFHFWGLVNSTIPDNSRCAPALRKYAWQDADAVGRETIKEAIEAAEADLYRNLGYRVAPDYASDTLPFPQYADSRLWRFGPYAAGDDRWLTVRLREGYVQAVGVESLTLIGNTAVAYSDADGDGINDTWTASIATTVTDVSEIAVYVPAAKRLDSEGANDTWRLRPITVSIAAGTATIRGKAWIMVDPIQYEGVDAADLDPTVAGNFLASVDVYRRICNAGGTSTETAQACLIWETLPWPAYVDTATDASTDPAAEGRAVARCGIRDARAGLLNPAAAVYNSTTGIWSASAALTTTSRLPDRVTIRYYAGHPWATDQNGSVHRNLELAVARLACAYLPRVVCNQGGHSGLAEIGKWQFDLSRASGAADEQYQISPEDLNCPFGTQRGQVWAWKQVKRENLSGGVAGG